MSKIIGKSGAQQLQSILDHISTQSNSTLFNVVGTVVLVFGATSIFTEIQSSLNYIWSIRAKPKKGWIKYIADRVLSFSLIIGCGFLFLASLMLNIIVDGLDGLLMKLLGDANIFLLRFLNILVLFCVVTALFAIIYKVLPDAVLRWKDAFIGAAFTGLLFLIGKFGITYYLSGSTKFNAFGAASSLILLLSWVYYSSMILFFGAEFTKVYAHKYGGGIRIKKTAVYIVKWESKDDLVHAEHNDG